MLNTSEDSDRNVIPRWRSFGAALTFDELSTRPPASNASHDQLLESVTEWRKRPRQSIAQACDLLSAAFANGLSDEVTDIAEFVSKQREPLGWAKVVASKVLAHKDTRETVLNEYPVWDIQTLSSSIRDARRRLRDHPTNPVLWTNLALGYTTLGQTKKARRAIVTATSLSKTNRFILRAASRFFLHIGDYERAHDILRRAPIVKSDPWVLAAELASARVRHRTSGLIRSARSLVSSQEFSAKHLSELNAALATLEAAAGSSRKARDLSNSAMENPTENAVAQTAWLARNAGVPVRVPDVKRLKSSEAVAWQAHRDRDWEVALAAAKAWQEEQPFSSRPAYLGGWVAAFTDDFTTAEQVWRIGHIGNPDEVMMANNLVFALAKQNKIVEAKELLDRISQSKVTVAERICLLATDGLVKFRSRDVLGGIRGYERAIALAKEFNLPRLGAIARIYLAIEQSLIGDLGLLSSVQSALDHLDVLAPSLRPYYAEKLNRLH